MIKLSINCETLLNILQKNDFFVKDILNEKVINQFELYSKRFKRPVCKDIYTKIRNKCSKM
jgi:hypothetical protein